MFFSKYRCPELVNPAEFLADLMSINNSSAESVYSSQKRIHGLVESFSQQTSSILYATPLMRRETSRNSMKVSTLPRKGYMVLLSHSHNKHHQSYMQLLSREKGDF
ncbi:ABC transporter G family member 7 [Camellia lanceoleosa]|uniref:ABC transporter G family member 7 n=1 Tax=Camellia lanceoleosa TaxID=1840588 RepID=A0ACC0ILB7_9ERIC|nr:ABC transporter G family member 7 [Camellia lanceoleosa]